MSLDYEALETSFDVVAQRSDDLIDEFFSRLSAAEPTLRRLLPEDLRPQKNVVLAVLVHVRKSLRNLDEITPTLRAIGRCNAVYGAQPEHYPIVGETLIGAMRTIAGPAWRPEHEQAWRVALATVADAMLDGATAASLAQAA
jgi:hemoglobin-like flavoprotein